MTTITTPAHDDRQGVDKIAEVAQRHPELVVVARTGWLAKGAVYAVAGVLAFSIATTEGSANVEAGASAGAAGGSGATQEASQSGALARIADSSAGTAALWAVAIGLALYVLWRVVSILLPAENSAKTWATRAGYLVSVVTYSVLAWSAVSFARNNGGNRQSENSRVERFTADLMERTGGRWLVGVVGLLLVAIGIFFAYQALSAKFAKELEPGGVGPISHDAIVKVGQVGWCGRAAMMGLIGFFLIRAAVQFRADEAVGLDGALRRVVDTAWGPAVVIFVGVGLVLYGLYCVISTPIRRLQNAD